jgi:hypothetical protein
MGEALDRISGLRHDFDPSSGDYHEASRCSIASRTRAHPPERDSI